MAELLFVAILLSTINHRKHHWVLFEQFSDKVSIHNYGGVLIDATINAFLSITVCFVPYYYHFNVKMYNSQFFIVTLQSLDCGIVKMGTRFDFHNRCTRKKK